LKANQDSYRELRKEAIDGLGESKDPASLKGLEELINDPNTDADMQQEAVDAISEKEPDVAVPLLVKFARTHKSINLRREAMDHLGEIPGQLQRATTKKRRSAFYESGAKRRRSGSASGGFVRA
jgi:HEAT repeat protein